MQPQNQSQNQLKSKSSLSQAKALRMSALIAIILNFFPPGSGFGLLYAGGSRMLMILVPVWLLELYLHDINAVVVVCIATIYYSLYALAKRYDREAAALQKPTASALTRNKDDLSDGEHIKYALKSFEGKVSEADRRLREQRTESGAAKSGPELMNKLAGAAANSHTLGDGSPEGRAAAAELLSVFESASNLSLSKPEDTVPTSVPLDFSPPSAVPEPSSLTPSTSPTCKNCGAEKGDFNFCTKCGLSFDM